MIIIEDFLKRFASRSASLDVFLSEQEDFSGPNWGQTAGIQCTLCQHFQFADDLPAIAALQSASRKLNLWLRIPWDSGAQNHLHFLGRFGRE
jgi:hypothetical protein